MRFVPTWFHGILDYAAGLIAIFSPEIFGFANLGGMPILITRVIGFAIIAYSLLTDYGPSSIKAIPMPAHLVFDFIAGVLLAMSPWVFGFSTVESNAWMPHLFIGISIMVAVLMSQSVNAAHHHAVRV